MEDYKKILDENYQFWQEAECPPESKLEYLGKIIFDFITYDGEADSEFAKKMIDVLDVIVNKTNFEYQNEGEEQYMNYLTMVNMPFLREKLEWGTSIRGAWLDDFKEYRIDCDRIIIKEGELTEFIKQLIKWAN